MSDRILSLLGLARRAGRLSLGNDAARESIFTGEAKLILLARDLSARTTGGMQAAAQQGGVPWVGLEQSLDEVGMALGKRVGVIAVNDQGFAKRLTELTAQATDKREGLLL